MKVGFFMSPLGYSFRLHKFIFAGEFCRNADPCSRLACFQKCFEQLIVAVWRFNKNLRAVFPLGGKFKFFNRFHFFVQLNRKIPDKFELLAIHTACHQS